MDFLIYSYATDVGRASRLIRSAQFHSLPLHLDGAGQQWIGYTANKLRAFHAFLQHLEKRTLVMFADAYDVVLCSHAAKFIDIYKVYGSPLLISAEAGKWPDRDICETYFMPHHRFSYVGSGVYMGRASALLRFLSWASSFENYAAPDFLGRENQNLDDQRVLTTYFLSHPDECALDISQRLVSNLLGMSVNDFELLPNGVLNRATGSHTCALHGHGPSRAIFKELARKILNHH